MDDLFVKPVSALLEETSGLLPKAGDRDRETLQSTSAGTMVQCEKSSIAALLCRGRSAAEPMAVIMESLTARNTFLRIAAPLPSIKLPASMNRVPLINIFFPENQKK
jgi:hypothetical protein